MKAVSATIALAATILSTSAVTMRPALACGFDEAGSSCSDDGAADEARWLLKRAVAAVKADEPKALSEFTKGQDGFRTQDLYVFCMSTKNDRMDAHPDPALMGKDARALRDPTGKHFAAEMLDSAREGQVTQISYLFPKPNSKVPVPKTSFVTRVSDQVCGVGFYQQ